MSLEHPHVANQTKEQASKKETAGDTMGELRLPSPLLGSSNVEGKIPVHSSSSESRSPPARKCSDLLSQPANSRLTHLKQNAENINNRPGLYLRRPLPMQSLGLPPDPLTPLCVFVPGLVSPRPQPPPRTADRQRRRDEHRRPEFNMDPTSGDEDAVASSDEGTVSGSDADDEKSDTCGK